MRIMLAGTRSFGVAALEELERTSSWLLDRIVCVVTPPGDKLAAAAMQLEIPVWDEIVPEMVAGYQVDLIVAAHSHVFIGEKSRRAATYGAIGYHPSLLPRHRGKDAVRWTIKMGDPIAGGTVYWFTNHVDGGPIAKQDWCHVRPGWDHHDLWSKELFPMGIRLLSATAAEIGGGMITQVDQDEALATWEPSWERPPVFRPELIELGDGNGHRYTINKEKQK